MLQSLIFISPLEINGTICSRVTLVVVRILCICHSMVVTDNPQRSNLRGLTTFDFYFNRHEASCSFVLTGRIIHFKTLQMNTNRNQPKPTETNRNKVPKLSKTVKKLFKLTLTPAQTLIYFGHEMLSFK